MLDLRGMYVQVMAFIKWWFIITVYEHIRVLEELLVDIFKLIVSGEKLFIPFWKDMVLVNCHFIVSVCIFDKWV